MCDDYAPKKKIVSNFSSRLFFSGKLNCLRQNERLEKNLQSPLQLYAKFSLSLHSLDCSRSLIGVEPFTSSQMNFHVLTMPSSYMHAREFHDMMITFFLLIYFIDAVRGMKIRYLRRMSFLLSLTLSFALESFYHSHLSQIIVSLLITKNSLDVFFCV